VLDVVFLMIISTFCTASDWDNCGIIVIMPSEMLDIVRADFDDIYGWEPIQEGWFLKGFHIDFGSHNLIYMAEEYSHTPSDYGCTTMWHELAHADMDFGEKFEHEEMKRKYKCGKDSMKFIG